MLLLLVSPLKELAQPLGCLGHLDLIMILNYAREIMQGLSGMHPKLFLSYLRSVPPQAQPALQILQVSLSDDLQLLPLFEGLLIIVHGFVHVLIVTFVFKLAPFSLLL
jgi:hypothetical protein